MADKELTNNTINIKTIIIGDTYSGKTSILNRYINRCFNPSFMATIGVDYYKNELIKKNTKYKFTIWDTSGQEKFNSIITSYYRDTGAVIFVFDLTNYNSFLNIKNWIARVELFSHNKLIKILVGNKCDLRDNRIDTNVIIRYCKHNNIEYIETSAKNNINIDEIFNSLSLSINKYIFSDNYNKKDNVGIKIINTFKINETYDPSIINLEKQRNPKKCCKIL